MFSLGLTDVLNSYRIEWLGGTSLNLIVTLAIRLIVGIGWYKMFERVGEAPWKAFVPVLGEYKAFRIAWDDFAFAVIFASTTLVAWVDQVGMQNTLLRAFAIVNLVLWWIMAILTSIAFQVSVLFGVIYALMPWIGVLVFGFSSVPEYQGPWVTDPERAKQLEKQKRKRRRKAGGTAQGPATKKASKKRRKK